MIGKVRRSAGFPLLGVLLCAVPALAWHGAVPVVRQESPEVTRPAPAATSGKDQLSAAWQVKKRSFKKEGEEKRGILMEAVAEYRKVGTMFPDDRASRALAAFRIGEILRSLDDFAGAESAFREVLEFSEQREVVARAFMELGHINRREKKYDLAIELYGQVVRQCPEQRERGSSALLWTAKCYLEQKLRPDARLAARTVIDDYDEDPKRVLEAYDLLASSYLDEGNDAMASDILEECRSRYTALAASGDDAYRGLVARIDTLGAAKKLAKKRTKGDVGSSDENETREEGARDETETPEDGGSPEDGT